MLTQSEIDALVGAVDGADEHDDRLTQPLATDSVLSAVGRSVKTYDFRRPDKFSKEQLRTLQAIHENVGRILGGRLSARLRTPVSISLSETSQMVFDEYVSELSLPTELVVMSADGLAGPFLIDFDLTFAYAAIERMLGGPGRISTDRREPTAIELELINRLVEEIGPAINEGWAHLERMGARITETALGPALLRVAAPSHVVAVLTYEIRLAGQTAPLTICYPHPALEPMLPRLSATAWYAAADKGDVNLERAELAAALQDVDIPIRAELGDVELSVAALVGLQAGDIIRFDQSADAPVRLSVMDQARAWALPGRVGDRMALRLITPLQPMEA